MKLSKAQDKTQWAIIVVTAVLSGLVTLVTGVILFNWQTRAPALSFRIQDALPFAAPTETLGIYHVTVLNSGSSVAEDVITVIAVPGAQIVNQRAKADASLTIEEVTSPDKYRLKVPTLNPGERVEISVLAKSGNSMPTRPTVSLRAKGYIGQEQISDNGPSLNKTLSGSLIAAYAGLFSVFLIRRTIVPQLLGRHAEDQREVLAYLCGMHGLVAEAERLLQLERKTAYWAEADRLGNLAATGIDDQTCTAIKQVLIDLLEYSNIADLSQAIVHFNIAKILVNRGDAHGARESLERARKLGGKLILKRLQLDPKMKGLS